ncbi:hypothetical protein [Brachybacterium phenoliresistens]|uniref:hypothetical protein n=1 Tax=Brachybacterium phenoliresistens TaxID=396014 RepID=UPI0031DC7990
MPRDVVEAVIASHDPQRPLERLLRSVLAQRTALENLGAELRTTVVCHNREIDEIAGPLAPEVRDQVDFLHLADGIYSPAGPINHGLEASEATWVTTIGSDDALAEGALAAWYRSGRDLDADAVLAPIRVPHGIVRTPFIRPSRPRLLDPVRDHLAYRTAPLGLLRRETLRRIGFAYTQARLIAGSDIEPGLRLWFRGGRITYPYGAPAYLVSEDMGRTRVTSTVGRVRSETGWLPPLLAQDWLRGARLDERQEIATKLARTQLVNAVRRRAVAAGEVDEDAWTGDDADALGTAIAGLEELASGPLPGLSRAEASVLAAAGTAGSAEAVRTAWASFSGGCPQDRVLPRRLRDLARTDARPRLFLEQQIAQRTGLYTHPAD